MEPIFQPCFQFLSYHFHLDYPVKAEQYLKTEDTQKVSQ